MKVQLVGNEVRANGFTVAVLSSDAPPTIRDAVRRTLVVLADKGLIGCVSEQDDAEREISRRMAFLSGAAR